jgi:hypothetical protein
VAGSFAYTPAAGAVLSAGGRTLSVTFTPADAADYNGASATAALTVNKASLLVTANDAARNYGVANPAFTASYSGFFNGENLADSGVTGSPSLSTSATAGSAPGDYAIAIDVSALSAANYTFTPVNGTLTVSPAPLSAAGVSFNATAGAPFSGAVATFGNADPFGSATSYAAVIRWGDGSASAGVISGTGTLTVTGSHTYADPVNAAVQVTISHKLGYTTTAVTAATATVTSLGLGVRPGQAAGIGFWHNGNGQALIDSLNGGPTSTALANWLAATFPNLYGRGAGVNNLTGASNAQVAAFYQGQFALHGPKVEAAVLGAALDVYATTLSLGGTAGQVYGFTVSAVGLGAYSFSVGADGAAFGVPNGSTRNVYELLEAVNAQAVVGVCYRGDQTLRTEATDLFDALGRAGAIS